MLEQSSSLLLGGEEMGMTDTQYKGMLRDQLEDLRKLQELAVKAGSAEIQAEVEKQIEKVNDKLGY